MPIPLRRPDSEPIDRTVFDHPAFETEHEALSIPWTSPNLADACLGRYVQQSSVINVDEVWLRHGRTVMVNPANYLALQARTEALQTVRDGAAEVLAWLNDASPSRQQARDTARKSRWAHLEKRMAKA